MNPSIVINRDLAVRVAELVDYGLTAGLGVAEPGKMCVEAAVCYALGLPHGDNPPCVGRAVRAFKTRLNDAGWSSKAARAAGMKKLAIAQLGSNEIDQPQFARAVATGINTKLLPKLLRLYHLEAEANACESSTSLTEMHTNALAAKKKFYAVAAAVAAAAAAGAAGAARIAAADARVAAVADVAAVAAGAAAGAAGAARIAAVAGAARVAAGAAGAAAAAARVAADAAAGAADADSFLVVAADIGLEALKDSPGYQWIDVAN